MMGDFQVNPREMVSPILNLVLIHFGISNWLILQ